MTTPNDTLAKLAADSKWLVYSGDDGWHSTVAIGPEQLRRAWLEHHYSMVDFDNLDQQQQDTAAYLDDIDNWQCDYVGEVHTLHVSYEGDYAGIIRIDDAATLTAQAPAVGEQNLAPGVMRCAKCKFKLIRNNLNINAGTITAGHSKTEPCPNGCGPLWPVTWEEEARDAYKTAEDMFDRWKAAESAQQAAQPMIPLSAMRAIAVEAIRAVTGCPDLSGNGKHLSDEIESVAEAAASSFGKAAQAPVGRVLVPEAPTDEMLNAAKAEVHKNNGARDKSLRIWRAMLTSRPQPEVKP